MSGSSPTNPFAQTYTCDHCGCPHPLVEHVLALLRNGAFKWEGCATCLERALTPPVASRDLTEAVKTLQAVKTLLYDLGLRGLSDKQRAVVSKWIEAFPGGVQR